MLQLAPINIINNNSSITFSPRTTNLCPDMTVDDAHAESLVSKASAAATLTSSSSTSIQALYSASLSHQARLEQHQDAHYLSLAPTFLSLHQQASSSKQLLSSLESFLSTFQSDLSTLSTHIAALQTTSHQIDERLDATKEVEIQLASFLTEIALSPRIVDLFFETEPDSRPELWSKAVKQLERVLEATSASATLPVTATSETATPVSNFPAVQEVRQVAEACRNVVASKLRTYLVSPHAAIKSSVTTNLQVVQTSVLLRHHRPLYAFLARQMPRVAIDVQRSYVAAARLYFETAFRRYARSLGVIRKRWVEAGAGGGSLITDPVAVKEGAATVITGLQSGMAALAKATNNPAASGNFFPPPPRQGANTPARTPHDSSDASDASTSQADPWLFPTTRLQYSRLSSTASTVLGYLADDSGFKACPENLFRSLSLVLMDNACSEYTFLVRFFEGIGDEESLAPRKSATSTVDPDDSVTTITVDDAEGCEGAEATVVQLSAAERRSLAGRGASEEIFKQVFEPSMSTWTTFTKTLLTPATSTGAALAASASSVVSIGGGVGGTSSSLGGAAGVASTPAGYFALLSMIQLNEAVLGAIEARGCSVGMVQAGLMAFKIQAYPLVKRFLDDQIAALSQLSASSSSSSSTASTTASITGGVWGMLSNLASSSTTASHTAPTPLTPTYASTLVLRYTSLLSKTLWILHDSPPDQGLLASLTRLRTELAKALTTTTTASQPASASDTWTQRHRLDAVQLLIDALEAVTSAAPGGFSSHASVQNEFAFWRELRTSLRA